METDKGDDNFFVRLYFAQNSHLAEAAAQSHKLCQFHCVGHHMANFIDCNR